MGRNPEVHAFDTFFYLKYTDGGYKGVERWTKKINIFAKSKLLIPINIVKGRFQHWVLVCVNVHEKELVYYDSMLGAVNPTKIMDTIMKYLCDEGRNKLHIFIDVNLWNYLIAMCPQQTNGMDCGVFVCVFAEYLTRGAAFNFTQDHMMSFRQLILHELSIQKLFDVNISDVDMFLENAMKTVNEHLKIEDVVKIDENDLKIEDVVKIDENNLEIKDAVKIDENNLKKKSEVKIDKKSLKRKSVVKNVKRKRKN